LDLADAQDAWAGGAMALAAPEAAVYRGAVAATARPDHVPMTLTNSNAAVTARSLRAGRANPPAKAFTRPSERQGIGQTAAAASARGLIGPRTRHQ
jgi:hypothetical protein